MSESVPKTAPKNGTIERGLRGWRAKSGRLRDEITRRPWLLAVMVALFVSLLTAPPFAFSLKGIEVGQYANRAIKADRDFDVEDKASTEARREEAAAAVLPVYDHDTQIDSREIQHIKEAFQMMRSFYGQGNPAASGQDDDEDVGRASILPRQAAEEQQKRFVQTLGVELDERSMDYLRREQFAQAIEDDLTDLVRYALTRLVVNNRQVLMDQLATLPGTQAVTVRELGTDKERTYTNFTNVLDLTMVLAQLEQRSRERIENPQRRAAVVAIARKLVRPTLDFNRAETENRRAQARANVKPSIIHFRRNQLIVAEGDQIAEDDLVILRAMRAGTSAASAVLSFLAVTVLLAIGMVALAKFAQTYVKKFKPNARDYAFLATAVASIAGMAWVAKTIAKPLAQSFTWLTPEAVQYIFPLAGFAMLVRFLLHSEAALVLICLTGPMAGLVADNSMGYAMYVLVGSLVGAHQIGRAEHRGSVTRAGLIVGAINSAIALAVQVIADPTTLLSLATPVNAVAAFLGGVLAGPFVLAVLPAFEALFGYTSNLRLMELAHLNHPLLERMLVEAPGTYHHSLTVSALAEKAAEAIGANPLLTKVAGLYHDVGKINKPEYYIENQIGMANPHDHLEPHMSSLILISHVRDGVDSAMKFRLGERIAAVIAQHHGTSRIRYFYDRAKALEDAGNKRVDDTEYRYKGPKPQSKEAALVMMADVAEAATRTLKSPTPARIEALVTELIDKIFADGQLDECEMTLRDLNKVAGQFSAVLNGRFHGRIEYPEAGGDAAKRGKVVSLPAVTAPERSETAE